jgi:putative transposase
MTTRWRPDFDPANLYFVTTTAAERTHIFRQDVVKRIVIDALYYVGLMNEVALYAFVIMPNHVHAIIQCPADFAPKDWARAFEGDASRMIVRHYQMCNNQAALDALQALVTRPDRQAHKVWEDGYLAKEVWSPGFLEEKMAYTHNNPVQPHWRLVGAPEVYLWSSARFYDGDGSTLIPVDDARTLLG